MATYQQYPTPPPTSSPKHSASYQPEPEPEAQAQPQPQPQSYEYPEPSPFTQPQSNPFPPPEPASAPPKIPAQDSYFHSFSAPGSPVANTTSTSQPRPSKPPRRRSSPLLSGPGGVQYAQPSSGPYSPSSLHRLSPRPLHFSPSNPAPSPYSAGRPKPRPGFWKRVAIRVEAWIRAFMRWSKRNPMIAGVLTFVPVMTVAGVVKLARGLGKGLGFVEKGFGRPPGIGGGEGVPGLAAKGLGGERGWALDDFKGFGGSEGGPFEGLLKVMQMLV